MNKYIKKYLPITVFLIFTAICIFLIGNANLFAPDEYNYSNIYNTTQRVSSLSDLRVSLSGFYNNWTGRILVHGAIQLFLWLNINLFYVLNSIVFILFLIGIIKLFRNKVSVFHLAITLFLIIYCTYAFDEKYIWISGSLNYLWPVTLMLYTLSFFYNGIVYEKKYSIISSFLYWILAFLTGWSQENTAFVTGSFIIALVLFNIKKLLKLPIKRKLYWLISIAIFGIGSMLLIFAPGNFVRLNTENRSQLYFINVARNLFHIQNLIVIYIVLFFAVFLKENSSKKNYAICLDQLKYVIFPCAVAISPMLIISEFYDRSMLPYEVLVISGIIYNLQSLLKNTKARNKLLIGATILFSFCSLFPLFSNSVFCIKYLKPYKEQYLSEAESQKQAGASTLVVSKFEYTDKIPPQNIICDNFLDSLNNDFINQFAARYFSVAAIYSVRENYCQIEINTDIRTNNSFSVVDENNNIIATRILNSRHPVSDISEKIIFELPKSSLETAIFLLPEDLQNHISSVVCREIGKIENIDKNSLNFGGNN